MGGSDQLHWKLRLHLAQGVGPVLSARLIEAFGSAQGVFSAGPGQWRRVDGIGEKTAAAMAAVTDEDVQQELQSAESQGVRVLCDEDADYPPALRQLPDRPMVLYVKGQLAQADAVAVGVVGSRHCTHYGLEQGERFGQLLGRAGLTVISGGARGIDTAAHRGALAGGGRTIAVMGCGMAHVYPPENARLFEEIVSGGRGALVSELPMRTAVLAGNFPTRNRIISGMSLGVLVVEAARRSGSLITARLAAEQNRVVFALPGRVDNPLSQGTNVLIRNGAILVQDLDDMLEHLGGVGENLSPDAPRQLAAAPVELSPPERVLVDALAEGPLVLDELVRRSRLPSGQVVSTMTMLVLKGLVRQQPGNVFARPQRGS